MDFTNKLMGQNQAETKIVAAISRGADIAIRYTTARRTTAPTPATINTARARRSPHRVGLLRTAITAIPVIAPLGFIAAHIINTQFIRALRADRMSCFCNHDFGCRLGRRIPTPPPLANGTACPSRRSDG